MLTIEKNCSNRLEKKRLIKYMMHLNHEGARHCRKPLGRRSVGSEISTISIIYIFVTFTHSNILLGSSWKSILETVNVTKV